MITEIAMPSQTADRMPDIEPTDPTQGDCAAQADRAIDIINDADDQMADLMADGSEVAAIAITTARLEGRQRQISACIKIPYPVENIWQILTDYDHLADFIPSLAKSQRIEHPQGGIRIEQIGKQSLLKIKFCARVVLDMVEQFPHQLDFQMVEGDFKQFSGSWLLQPLDEAATELRYTITVLPTLAMPVGLIERKLQQGLVANLSAIRQQADRLFG